ncbi:nucleotidyltransferase domain-containing protein [Streptosporangium roseum]|uniref:nucleotidyltransferase domain-containing protein n=1 Tax=Streptosporangium roseum TaxID=2001 RepID=UPI00332478B6
MIPPNTSHVLLAGIVGSTAYGLAGPGSDIDTLGIFAAPTRDLVGLRTPDETHVSTKPDRTLHEAKKWCLLALNGNPAVLEITWLPDDLYQVRTPLGEQLIAIRSAFLAAPRVRDAYLGYAAGQFKRLSGRFGPNVEHATRKRAAKEARHLARLITQGCELYATGTLTVRLDSPDLIRDFGDRVAAGDLDEAKSLLDVAETFFDNTRSPLPARPNEGPVREWLSAVRTTHWEA